LGGYGGGKQTARGLTEHKNKRGVVGSGAPRGEKDRGAGGVWRQQGRAAGGGGAGAAAKGGFGWGGRGWAIAMGRPKRTMPFFDLNKDF
jgi:hypothetical protein